MQVRRGVLLKVLVVAGGGDHLNVVVGVSIVRDEGTAVIVARQLDLILIDRIHLHLERVIVDLHDRFGWGHGGCGDFWAHVEGTMWFDVPANLVKLDTVGAAAATIA